MMYFERNTPYPDDLPMLAKLGLKPWVAGLHEEVLVGEVRPYADEEPEGEQTKIQIFVSCAPAQFYRFVVERKSEDDDFQGMERVEVNTGSGLLSTYWPMALAVADRMLVVGTVERLTH